MSTTTRERDDLAFENVRLVAACLAYKGFRAQHPAAADDAAHAWSDDNWHLYIEDAWQWLLDELDGLLAEG